MTCSGPFRKAGSATILIDGFEYLYEHTDSSNIADLREVLSLAPNLPIDPATPR